MLAGREELLTQLDILLSASAGPAPRTVPLYGLGGAGKTSVAVEYAYRHLAEVAAAWQFLAEDTTVLAAGFGELAAQLGARGLADTRDPVASVHSILAKFPAPWLLIFDNAADMASVAAFLPPAGPGHVLITSQNPNWPGQALEVPMLERRIAADFLVNRTRDPDRQAAEDLADIMDGLPLALEQAAAYVQAVGDTLAGYLALFRQRRAEMLARGEPTGYSKTVASTWALAFDRLQQTEPTAVGLLRLLAFCAPEAIPLRLLLQPRPGLAERLGDKVIRVLAPLLADPLAAKDAIGALRRYSLVTPAAAGAVSVHRLVQAVTADQMPAEVAREWQQAAAALIEAAIPRGAAQPNTWADFAGLLPHAQATLTADSDGMAHVASYLGHSGSYAAARDLTRDVAEACARASGPEHPYTLAARNDLADWTGRAGDAAGARDQYAALLPVVERVHGPEHPDTLVVRAFLATWTGQAGDAARARDQYAALLPVRERVSGPEHPDTLMARGHLADWTGWTGDAAGARDQYAALLPVVERVVGPEHPYSLVAVNNLALWIGRAGDAAGPCDLFAALLPVLERVHGPEHRVTLIARRHLADWTGQAGDAAGARDQYAALLPVLERVLSPEHPDTLTVRNNLAASAGEAGDDAAGARDQYAAVRPVLERVLGPEDPRTLVTRYQLAYWTSRTGDAAGARDQCAALLPMLERVLGSEHHVTLIARRHLAIWTAQAGDAAGARDQYAALIPVLDRVLGPGHSDTLAARNNLAASAGQAGDTAGARDQYAALLPVLERVFGPEDPRTLATRYQLAYWTSRADGGSSTA